MGLKRGISDKNCNSRLDFLDMKKDIVKSKRSTRACTRKSILNLHSCKRSTPVLMLNTTNNLATSKRSNSRLDFLNTKGNIAKSRRSQVMQLPFGMMFSILLIAVFVFVAFYAVGAFLSYRDCSQIGIFIDGLKNDVANAWTSSESSSSKFSGALPSGIEYVCFADIAAGRNEDGMLDGWWGAYAPPSIDGEEIVDEIENYPLERNMFFYPAEKACSMAAEIIEHINITETINYGRGDYENPYCIENTKGKVSMMLEKGFNEALVSIGRE